MRPTGALPLVTQQLEFPSFDVDGDNFVVALDALQVINFINGVGGEGETENATRLLATLDTNRAAWLATLANPLFAALHSASGFDLANTLGARLPTSADRRDRLAEDFPAMPFMTDNEPVNPPAWTSRRVVRFSRAIQPQICDPLFAEFDELMSCDFDSK